MLRKALTERPKSAAKMQKKPRSVNVKSAVKKNSFEKTQQRYGKNAVKSVEKAKKQDTFG